MAIKISSLLTSNTNLESDTTPVLGGNLDTNDFEIANGVNPITFGGSSAVELPVGDTASRPVAPSSGAIRYNTDTQSIEGYYSGDWISIVNSDDGRLSLKNVVIVSKEPGPGQYSSVAAALASITDESNINPYVIILAPGVFEEPTLTLRPYISITGTGDNASIIKSVDPSTNLIVGAPFSSLCGLTLTGATDIDSNLVYLDTQDGSIQTSFILFNVLLGEAYRLCRVVSGSLQLTSVRFGGTNHYSQGFWAEDDGVNPAHIVFRQVYSNKPTPPYADYLMRVGGTKTIVIIQTLFNRPRAVELPPLTPAGIGLWAYNGSTVWIESMSLLGFDTGIWVENNGAPPYLEISSCLLSNNIEDLKIEHPGTTGSFTGTASSSLSQSASPNFTLMFLDPANGGANIVGNLFIGADLDILTNVTDLIQISSPVGILSGGIISTTANPLEIEVGEGFGYRADPITGKNQRFEWPTQLITLPDDVFSYVYFNTSGTLVYASSPPDPLENITVALAHSQDGEIERLIPVQINAIHSASQIDYYLRNVIGPVVLSGLVTTEGTAPRRLSVTAGVVNYSILRFNSPPGVDVTFEVEFHDAGQWTYLGGQIVVSNTHYDNGTELVPLTSGYYTKHVLYAASNNGVTKYYVVYGQAEYALQTDAESGDLPTPPPHFTGSVSLAAIIVQEGVANISRIIDLRPRVGGVTQAVLSTADHGQLLGLDHDDHPQYLLTDGNRALTGNLNLNSNNITNANLINGVSITAHGSRHGANSADAIPTAAAVGLSNSSTNTAGSSNNLARSDHTHQITGFQLSDSDLTALANTTTTGLYVRTGSGTSATRTITGTTNQIDVVDGDGINGNPTLSITTNPVLPGTESVTVPIGTTAERPGSPQTGDLRFNTTLDELEIYNNSQWVFFKDSTTMVDEGSPTGFVNRTDSVISFNEGTRFFSISPKTTSYTVYSDGRRFVKTGTETIQISNTSGGKFIYFDPTGALIELANIEFGLYTFITYIYWDTANQKATVFADERHGVSMDPITHMYLHESLGTQYISGLDIEHYTTSGTGTSNSDVTIGITSGVIFDEDISVNIVNDPTPLEEWEQILSPVGKFPIMYKQGSVWTILPATDYPVHFMTDRIAYNQNVAGNWQLTEIATNGHFATSWVMATSDIRIPVIVFLGQHECLTLEEAIEESQIQNLDLSGFPFIEFRILYRLIYQTDSAYTNATHSKLVDVTDVRLTKVSSVSITTGVDHSHLDNLSSDSHLQYVHISNPRTITATHTFNPASSGPPFILGANATNQLVTSFNADLLDGLHSTAFQPIDADLTSIAALSGTGLPARTADNTWALRTITAGTNISVADGTGVAGNPTVSLNLPLTTKGDILTRDNSVLVRVPVGINGQSLIADSTQTSGLRWALPPTTYTGSVAPTSGVTTISSAVTPTITDGTQLWSQAITPKATSSRFIIRFSGIIGVANNNRGVVFALFRGNTFLNSTVQWADADKPQTSTISFIDSPNTVSSITYSLRIGIAGGAGTWYISQGNAAGTSFGGSATSWYTIEETE